MSYDKVSPGKKIPETFNVIIEIPMNADPVKYEVDKETGCLFVDRFMGTAMHYPCNYGYIPKTIAGDGDPVDVLVITPFALVPGSVVSCRAIGMLEMEDEGGQDAKLLAVPDLCSARRSVGFGRGGVHLHLQAFANACRLAKSCLLERPTISHLISSELPRYRHVRNGR